MDGNMPSGESLCRQLLYGQRYFQSRFSKRSDVLVLPDTCEFTYSEKEGLTFVSRLWRSATPDRSAGRVHQFLHPQNELE